MASGAWVGCGSDRYPSYLGDRHFAELCAARTRAGAPSDGMFCTAGCALFESISPLTGAVSR